MLDMLRAHARATAAEIRITITKATVSPHYSDLFFLAFSRSILRIVLSASFLPLIVANAQIENPNGAPKAQPIRKIASSVMLSPPKHKYIISDISVIIN